MALSVRPDAVLLDYPRPDDGSQLLHDLFATARRTLLSPASTCNTNEVTMRCFQWTVASRLRLLSVIMVLSGIFGVIGAVEITKCAKMHELNTLHLRYNHAFWNEMLAFAQNDDHPIAPIKEELLLVRQQPVDCLDLLGPLERAVITLTGNYQSITICEYDVALADQTLAYIDQFEAGQLKRDDLAKKLRSAGERFNLDSIEFEPLVDRTVESVSKTVVTLVILKAILVGLAGWLMSRSVGNDYKRLQATEKALEASNKELQSFVYRTSHDFRSPLLGIISMARFVEDDIEEGHLDEALANIRRIRRNAKSLESVTVSTLQMAKTDLAHIHVEPVELESLLQRVWERLSEFAHQRGVTMELGTDIRGMVVNTDSNQLQSVIENLMSNAIKYFHDARDRCFVRVDAVEQADGSISIEVTDNGIGIPSEFTSDVFEMFKQFHPQRAQGTGLGLYIAKKSVERLGGSIDFVSSSDGTCFHISIPNNPIPPASAVSTEQDVPSSVSV